MNDIEKAIEEISKMQFEHRDYRSAIFKKDGIPLMYTESVDLAIEALEKQTPKKVKDIDDNYSYFECSCGFTVGYMNDFREHKYCLDCGQKLDWSEVEDE